MASPFSRSFRDLAKGRAIAVPRRTLGNSKTLPRGSLRRRQAVERSKPFDACRTLTHSRAGAFTDPVIFSARSDARCRPTGKIRLAPKRSSPLGRRRSHEDQVEVEQVRVGRSGHEEISRSVEYSIRVILLEAARRVDAPST